MGGLRLQHRIVIPFAVVALVATTATAYVAWSVTSAALQTRLQTQLRHAATAVSRGDLALNPAILRTLQDIIGAEIVTFGADGRVVATTAASDDELVLAAARRAIATPETDASEPGVVRADCGVPCIVAYRAVEGRPGTVVALVARTTELSTATQAVARVILFGAGLSVLVMLLVSQAVVRRVTAPLGRLIRFVSDPSPEPSRRAEVGQDEIGALADAFNGMLDRLQRSQEALVRSEKLALAGIIAARVAHDIRNPLSSIKMQTQLLAARVDDAEAGVALAAVLHDIEQMESVIRDLLELARPGQLRLDETPVNTVIRDALRQLSAQFVHRKIVVDARLEDAVPSLALDHHRFRQVLLNVLANAAEAMPTGGEIVVASRVEADEAVVVEICDDGVGVDPAILDRVFDPFVSSKRDGIGLGLVTAKAVVEGHGGRISLRPRTPRGTCVVIRLPLRGSSPS